MTIRLLVLSIEGMDLHTPPNRRPVSDAPEPFHRRVAIEVWVMVLNRLDEGDDPLAESEDEPEPW